MLVYFKDDSAYTAIQFATLLNYQLTKKLVTRNRVIIMKDIKHMNSKVLIYCNLVMYKILNKKLYSICVFKDNQPLGAVWSVT